MKKISTILSLALLVAVMMFGSCAKREFYGATYTCQCTTNVYEHGVVTETTVTNTSINSTDPENAQILCNSYDQNLTQTGMTNGQTKNCMIK